jgi:transposase
MSKVNRNQPKRSSASESSYSLMEFMREFPDDATCLEWLWRERFSEDGRHAECPKCERERAFYRVKSRPSYCCDTCGHHLHPTAGTIFHKSATSLHLWFYAMYLMTSTRCGISAKHIEREIGVTYKTAWRMCNLIRNALMAEDDGTMLDGEVEADETWIGGKAQNRLYPKRTRQEHEARKTAVFAAVERKGRVVARVIPDSQDTHMHVRQFVMPTATVYTDDWKGYWPLSDAYDHRTINHTTKVYVDGDVHTQTIEGFFGNFKTGVRGAHHSISRKWLQGYLNEWTWRYNHRDDPQALFQLLLGRTTSVTTVKP